MIGTMGRALIAAPVAIAAETPQIEMPEASGTAHSRGNFKYFARHVVHDRPIDQVGLDDRAQTAEHDRPGAALLVRPPALPGFPPG